MAIQDIRFPQRSSSLSALSKTETVDKVLTTPKRSHSILRNSSLPSKPDLSKTALTKKRSISFSRDIEHICLFKRFESPRTIATNEQYSLKDHGDLEAASISGAIDSIESSWKILGTNRPPPFRLSDMGALTLEDVYFATDSLYRHRSSRSSGRSLVVDILVRNIAFQKYVGVRYSRDNWVTWNEMPASFVGSVSPSHQFHEGLDRLRFQIQLDEEFENTGNQKDATFQFALKYQVSGRDHWDSNSKRNYQIQLQKRIEPKRVMDSHTLEDDMEMFLHGTKLDLLLSKPSCHRPAHRRSVSLTSSKPSTLALSKTPSVLLTPTVPALNMAQKPISSPRKPISMPQYQPIHSLYQALPSVSYIQHGPYSTTIESPLTSEIFDFPSSFNYPSATSRTLSPATSS